jgi:uncharacterized protein YjiS (DUF1127 family)
MVHANIERGLATGIGSRISAALADWREYRKRVAVYHETLRELRRLSDRDLLDMGLHKSQIEDVAREAAFGR